MDRKEYQRQYSARRRVACKDEILTQRRQYYKANRERILADERAKKRRRSSNPRATRKSKYGLSDSAFKAKVISQNNLCDLCGLPLGDDSKNVVIDHDHRCCGDRKACEKCIRGVIHRKCNAGLGMFDDDPTALLKAAKYLEKYRK